VPEHFERLMALRNGIEQPSTFWRSSIHRKAGELDESYSLAFDWEWWNRLRGCGARFKVIKDVLSVYYFTDDNLTSKAGMRVINEMYRITKTYGPYRGYLADVYRVLFRLFDMKDIMTALLSTCIGQTILFRCRSFHFVCYFGREAINAYN
jgi:hypothetical protein